MKRDLFNQNLNEIQVSYKQSIIPQSLKPITTSKDAFEIFRDIYGDNIDFVEYFYMLLLNRANQVISYYMVSKGGTSGTIADPKVIFSVALKAKASTIIIAHNHPSGNLKPSEMDRKLTKRMVEAGKLLELPVLDHIILTSNDQFFSFADEGML